jgi:hypothetical protein
MESMVGLKKYKMITKYKIFENINNPKYKTGDKVYYHGSIITHHGYYTVINQTYDDKMWKYILHNEKTLIYLKYVWETSISETEKEGKIKNKEFNDRRLMRLEFDPYGEEEWENESVQNDIDPYGEENWNEEEIDEDEDDDDNEDDEDVYNPNVCRSCGNYVPNVNMLDDLCPNCRYKEESHCISCGTYVPKEFLDKDRMCDLCLKDPLWFYEF